MNFPQCAFTVDVEDYFQVDAFSDVIPVTAWDSFESRVVANTSRLLDLLDAHQVRGTFFVLGWIAERHPALVKAMECLENRHQPPELLIPSQKLPPAANPSFRSCPPGPILIQNMSPPSQESENAADRMTQENVNGT